MLNHVRKTFYAALGAIILGTAAGGVSLVHAAVSSEKTPAQLEWKALGKINLISSAAQQTWKNARERYGNGADLEVWAENTRLEYRQKGLKLWRKYPDEPLRFLWLNSTLRTPTHYWIDVRKVVESGYDPAVVTAQIDEKAQAAWDRELIALRAEVLVAPEKYAQMLHFNEIYYDISNLTQIKPKGQQVNVNPLLARLLDSALQYCARQDIDQENAGKGWKTRVVWDLFSPRHMHPANYGSSLIDDPRVKAAVLGALKGSGSANAREIGQRFERLTNRQIPMELKTVMMDGRTSFDFAQHRGKVVLVYIWDNGCAGCIEAMPDLQALNEKYREHGFEVVGIWKLREGPSVPDVKEWATARRFIADKGALYPQVAVTNGELVGKELPFEFEGVALNRGEFLNRYPFIDNPNVFFLDRSGRLASLEGRKPHLERETRKLLGLPPLAQSGGSSTLAASQ